MAKKKSKVELKLEIGKAKHYYEIAKKAYSEVIPLYNEVLEFTDPFVTLTDVVPTSSKINSRRSTMVAITEPLSSLNSFVMTTMFSRGSKWTSLEYAMEKASDGEEEDARTEPKEEVELPSEAEIELEEHTELTFGFIEQSNYYTVISRGISDALTLGTGCFRVIEKASTTHPFSYEYIPMSNLYIYDDAFGKPNYVFRDLGEVTVDKIKDLYGADAKVNTDGEEEYKKTYELIECVIPEYDEETGITRYVFAVVDTAFENIIYESTKERNPFVVFRADKTKESPYGIGLGVKLLETYKMLTEYKSLRQKHAKKIVDPPGGFVGDPKLFMKLRLTSGARNFLGTGIGGNQVEYKQLYTAGNIVDINDDITKMESEIREVCMANPLGNVNETKNRTASELTLRMELFRERFANIQENFQEELMQPAFLQPLSILLKKNILTFEKFQEAIGDTSSTKEDGVSGTVKDILEVSNFKYINEMSKAGDREDVDNLSQYIGIIAQTQPEKIQYAVKPAQYIAYIGDKMNIPMSVRYNAKEIEDFAKHEEEMMAQQQEQEMQMQGEADSMQMNREQVDQENVAADTRKKMAEAEKVQGGMA